MASSNERLRLRQKRALDQPQAVYDEDGVRLRVRDGDTHKQVLKRDEPLNLLNRQAARRTRRPGTTWPGTREN